MPCRETVKPFVKTLQTSYLQELFQRIGSANRDFVTIFYESRWGVGGKLRKGRKGRELKIIWWITITASFLLGRVGCLALHRDGISRHGVSSPPCTSTSAPRAAPDRDFDRSRCRGPSCSTYRESSVNLRSRKTFEFSKITDRTFEFSS